MVVFGQIGRGKSAFVKTFLWRQAVFGRRAWVVDPKGEYGDLADAWGVRPVALRPGGAIRLNPLDPGPDADGDATAGPDATGRRRMELLSSLASACLGRALVPRERAALGAALAEATASTAVPTVPVVVEALLSPSDDAARALRTERARPARGRARRRARAAPARARRPLRHVRRADDGRARPLRAAGRPRSLRAVLVGRARRPHGVRDGLAAGRAGPDAPAAAPGSHRRAGAASSSWSTRPGRSSPTWAWPAGCSRRGSSRVPSASPTWRCCTGCRTCARSARRTPSRWHWPRGCCRTRRPGWSTRSRPASWRRRRSCSPCRPPRRICCRSSGAASHCGRWASARSWSSTASARWNACIVDTDAAMTARLGAWPGSPRPWSPLALGGALLAGISSGGAGLHRPAGGAGDQRARGARWARRTRPAPAAGRPASAPRRAASLLGVAARRRRGCRCGGRDGPVAGGGRARPRAGRRRAWPCRPSWAGAARWWPPASRATCCATRSGRARGGGACGASTPRAARARRPARWSPLTACRDWREALPGGRRSVRGRQGRRHHGRRRVLVRHGGQAAGPALRRRRARRAHHDRRRALGRHPGGRRGGGHPRARGAARGARCGAGDLVPRRAHAQLGLHHGRDRARPLRPCARRIAGGRAASNRACSSEGRTPCTCVRRRTTSAGCAGTSPR